MAVSAFVVHKGSLDGTEELTGSLGLSEGTRLLVASHDNQQIVLRREQPNEVPVRSLEVVLASWQSLQDMLSPPVPRTPEWQAMAEDRKRHAQEQVDRAYADPLSGATEIKNAEREWELADDELDFGPFLES